MAKWKVQFVFLPKNPDGTFGAAVAQSEEYSVVTRTDSTEEAKALADDLFIANPKIQHTPEWRSDGDYLRYANIKHDD